MEKESNKIIFVVGPTAVGKSQLALRAAEKAGGLILNGDSIQSFSSVNIGAAKPTREDQARVPHLLFDMVNEGDPYTAGKYRKNALKTIEENLDDHHLFFVGGSGFYFRALEKGMYDVDTIPESIRVEFQKRLDQEGPALLYEELQFQDPAYAENISGNDPYRIIRALCLIEANNKTVTQIQKEFEKNNTPLGEKYPLLKVGLSMDRDRLREKVKQRTVDMIERGLLDEVKNLVEKGLEEWSPMQSVGYKEAQQYLRKELNFESMKEEIIKNTMRLAKKQMTWFKKDSDIQWFDGELETEKALSYLEENL